MSDLDDQRFNDTLRRMLATPPKPHEPLASRPKRSLGDEAKDKALPLNPRNRPSQPADK
jgi:hypothetical protein